MIVLDLVTSKSAPPALRVRKRELTQFLTRARQALGTIGSVSVLLTGDERIRAMNRQFRQVDSATDVLSFPPAPFAPAGHAGDLAISIETALRQAEACGHSLQTELQILLLHGLLHLMGMDHETDDGAMARRERQLRERLALPSGLIERSSSRALAGSERKLRGGRKPESLNPRSKNPRSSRGSRS